MVPRHSEDGIMNIFIAILSILICATLVVMAGPLGFIGFLAFCVIAFFLTMIADGIQGWFDGRR